MADLPTPEELGEKLQAGEITKEEAIEVMSERARREAFRTLYGGGSQENGEGGASGGRAPFLVFGLIVVLLILLFGALQMLR